MSLKIQVKGEAELNRKIKAVRRRLGMSMGEFADESAKSVRDAVVRNAQPFGTGKKAREKGEKAIAKDLLRVFRIVNDGKAGRRAVRSMSEAREIHQRRRGGNGRTREGRRVPILASVWRSYLAEVFAKVGTAKGSVAGGGESRLKARVPKWVKAHEEAGKASRKRKVAGAEWTFRASPPHVASGRVLGKRGVDRVMRLRKKILLRRLERKERAELKKAQRKING